MSSLLLSEERPLFILDLSLWLPELVPDLGKTGDRSWFWRKSTKFLPKCVIPTGSTVIYGKTGWDGRVSVFITPVVTLDPFPNSQRIPEMRILNLALILVHLSPACLQSATLPDSVNCSQVRVNYIMVVGGRFSYNPVTPQAFSHKMVPFRLPHVFCLCVSSVCIHWQCVPLAGLGIVVFANNAAPLSLGFQKINVKVQNKHHNLFDKHIALASGATWSPGSTKGHSWARREAIVADLAKQSPVSMLQLRPIGTLVTPESRYYIDTTWFYMERVTRFIYVTLA